VTTVALLDLELAISVYHDLQMERAEERTRQLTEEIATFDAGFQKDLQALDRASGVLRDSATQLGTSAAEAAHQASAVSGTAGDMAQRIGTGAEAGNRMTSTIQAIQGNAERSLDIANRAVEQAQSANTSVQGLNDMAERISSVVEMITEIAERTNLLALNATIEAARAGEAGRGFAVVASEVKALATQTARATEEISTQVRAIQDATRGTADGLAGIGGTIGEVAAAAEAIAQAVQDQSEATVSISETLNEVSDKAEHVASAIGSVSEAASETGAVSSSVEKLSGELDEQARRMRKEVQAFFARINAA
jgi:methyl-accepting chemotaxis protein